MTESVMRDCWLRTLTVFFILFMWINKAGAEDEEDHFGLDEQYYNEMVTLASGYLQNVSQSIACNCGGYYSARY